MKKLKFLILPLLLVLLMCACGGPKFDEKRIMADLNGRIVLSDLALPIEKLTVDNTRKSESGDEITVNISVDAASTVMRFHGCYILYYGYAEKEWSLNGFYFDKTRDWEATPLKGISAKDALLEVGEGWTLADSSEDLEKGICSFRFQKEEEARYNKCLTEISLEYRFSADNINLITWEKSKSEPVAVDSQWDILGKWQTLPTSNYMANGWSARNLVEITSVTKTTAHVIARCRGAGGVIFDGDVPLDPMSGIDFDIENPYNGTESFALVINPDKAYLNGTGIRPSEELFKADTVKKPDVVVPDVTDMTCTFDDEAKTVVIRSYKGSDKCIRIPEKIDGCTVIAIDDNAFSRNKYLFEIELPDSIKSIGKEAFYKCENLREVILPKNLEIIGDSCFAYCGDLYDLVLPEGIKEIGSYAFEDCSFDDFVLPKNVTVIPKGLFAGSSITSISMGGVTEIGDSAFVGCSYLREIVLPNTVQTVGDAAFRNCARMKTLKLNAGLVSIGEEAFADCDITEVVIPDSVTTMGELAFARCRSLAALTLSKNCPVISAECFVGCYGLIDVTIPEGVNTIDYNAFYSCKNLNTISLPKTLKNVAGSFSGCERLTTVYYAGTEQEWKAISIPDKNGNSAILDATIRFSVS